MPFVPALNTAQVVISYLSEWGEDAKNVMHFRNTAGAITSAGMDDLKGLIYTWLNDEWADLASDSWQTDLIVIRDMTVQDGLIKQYVETVNGTDPTGGLPAQDTVAISWRTGFAGPSRRGRTYHVGLRAADRQGSTIQSASVTALIARYSAILTVLLASDWEFVIASFVSGGAPRTTALLTPVTHCILSDVIVDSMDSRKPRDLQ